MTRRPRNTAKGSRTSHVFMAENPGDCVSVDQMICSQPGFVAQLKGKLTNERYRAITVFVDHYSDIRFIYLMTSYASSEETIRAKEAFEMWALLFGVSIRHYHCDNGRFQDNAWKGHCTRQRQAITYCGVNAHHQNGRAERAIRDIQNTARRQLLHAKAKWPHAIDLSLWPYSCRHAVQCWNSLPVLEGGISRLQLFAQDNVGTNLRDIHSFGCPTYALQSELAAGNTIPRWLPRCRLGINLGPSPHHARNVYLILNLHTGLVSPQYHVQFDDSFESIQGSPDDSTSARWKALAGFVNADAHDSDPTPDIDFLEDAAAEDPDLLPTSIDDESTASPADDPLAQQPADDAAPATLATTLSSRGRSRTPNVRLTGYQVFQADFIDYDALHDYQLAQQERMRHPISFMSEMTGDIMYFHQAMKQHDADDFRRAVIREINGHVRNKNWEMIPRNQVPAGQDVIPSVWSMRRKRNLTTNEITKHKARLNVHGGKQTFGLNYFETYSPVVTWFAIRLMITFAINYGWKMRQIDFVMAYTQAPIEQDLYMDLPQGLDPITGNRKDYVLKLKKNIFGQKQAGRVWNQFLTDKLRSIGFTPSNVDECVFYRGSTIFIVYVDDGLVFDLNGDNLDSFVEELRGVDLNVEDQGEPSDYVGVNINKGDDASYLFSQQALTDAIIKDVGLADTKRFKTVPAKSSQVLHAFPDSPKHHECFSWNYRSLIGKLNYLAQSTRPDILTAVHSAARFSQDPRKEHGEAVMHIAMYLNKTRDKGLRFRPNPARGFECYVDADFAGLWNANYARDDISTAKCRAGWTIFYAGCPIISVSKLISQIALSTTEAEYIALSMALRDVIPIMQLVEEIKARGFPVICDIPDIYCKTFEDNSGALELARLPKLRPRTKHINQCYHHWRSFARQGLIRFYPIDTLDQPADALSKNLPQNLFEKHRNTLLGESSPS